jgi:hypothetical protein
MAGPRVKDQAARPSPGAQLHQLMDETPTRNRGRRTLFRSRAHPDAK